MKRNVNQYGGITAAASDAATAGKTLVVSDTQTLTANTTISADRALVITKGGSITKASTYTLTINGPFDTGDYQVFSGLGEISGDITVTGATLGDFCIVSAPYDLQGAIATGYVQAADTVKIRLQNESGGTLNFDSGTWRVRTLKQ